jgi:peptide/nickel transport system substrate-binding protein
MKRSHKLIALASLLVIASMALAACGPSATPQTVEVTRVVAGTPVVETVIVTATPPPKATGPKAFIFGAQGEPVCLDPTIITDGISGRVTNQVYEGLVKFDGSTTNVIPSLAESWTTSDDGLVWKFKLHEGVKFHDGTDFNAEAVVKNWDYWHNTSNPLHKAQLDAGQVFEYYEAQFGGFDDASIIASVEATGTHEVTFTLRQPQGPFLNNLGMFIFVFWSPAALEAAGTDSCKTPVGTGPFKFVEWKQGEQVVLEKFADYWDTANAAKVDQVIIRNIPNNSQRLLALSAGEIHGMEGLESDDVAALQANPDFQVLLRPTNTTGYVAFNYNYAEFQDVRVRQAFAHAIDKKAIVDAFYEGTGLVAKEFQPPSLWGYNPDIEDYAFDTTKAKALLAEAGFPDGLSEVTAADGAKVALDFWYMPVSRPYYPNPKDIATAIAAQLAEAGIKVNLQTVDWATYLARRSNGDLMLYMLGWTGDNGDPDNFVCYFFCDPPRSNEGFVNDAEVAEILAEAARLTDQAERAKLYQQAEQLIHDRTLRIFVANNEPPLAFAAGVTGYVPNPTGTEFFNTVDVP